MNPTLAHLHDAELVQRHFDAERAYVQIFNRWYEGPLPPDSTAYYRELEAARDVVIPLADELERRGYLPAPAGQTNGYWVKVR